MFDNIILKTMSYFRLAISSITILKFQAVMQLQFGKILQSKAE